MKATDLMIGDLINGFGVVRRVTSIFGLERPEDDGLLTTMVPGCEFPESNLSFRPCYARPIPLTKEILEKNGFKIVYGFGYSDKYPTLGWGYHNGIHDYCSIDVTFYDTPINGVSHLVKINRNSASGDGINTVHNCDIDYVHQLQHAIRLCGIEKEIEL